MLIRILAGEKGASVVIDNSSNSLVTCVFRSPSTAGGEVQSCVDSNPRAERLHSNERIGDELRELPFRRRLEKDWDEYDGEEDLNPLPIVQIVERAV